MLSIKDRILLLAEEHGMSISALELNLGFGNGTIQKWDKVSPSIDKIRKVANYFNVSVGFLCDGEDEGFIERDRLREAMLHNENIRGLMDMASKCSADEIMTLKEMLKTWKKLS